MVFSKLTASFALLLAFACSAVLAADPAPSKTLHPLTYVAAKCYTRSQTCCYKYIVCGELCKKVACVDKKICVLKKNHRCLKYITVRVCEIRCYAKYCPKLHCSPFRIRKHPLYKAPKQYVSKTYKVKTQTSRLH